jgi:hypothetical protein
LSDVKRGSDAQATRKRMYFWKSTRVEAAVSTKARSPSAEVR